MELTIKRGDIYYAELNPVIGSEQGGTRPVLIISNDIGNKHSPTVIIAPITSRIHTKAKLPTHAPPDRRCRHAGSGSPKRRDNGRLRPGHRHTQRPRHAETRRAHLHNAAAHRGAADRQDSKHNGNDKRHGEITPAPRKGETDNLSKEQRI